MTSKPTGQTPTKPKNEDDCCSYEGKWYKEDAIICRGGTKWQCNAHGEWTDLKQKCDGTEEN